ncbi:asparagine synthase (glutamine-hydrolyzing) [Azospirillum argentinense]|uniref:asparagine synthase (glutamine-hydrolyzing) n=1 Tax=Azospirillum argentinense TaxID=2970906 RepID=UPI0032E04F64
MCGIAGILDPQCPPEEKRILLARMTDAIRHRGPDGEGITADGLVGLGMRRLAIIDLPGGEQPMADADASVQLVFNGEIYNFAILREELARRGHVFRTRSDTEVVLRLYLDGGLPALERMNGMFAIAIWDGRSRTLHLMRDRLGVKPLYVAWDGQRLLFASEIKAILASGVWQPRVSGQAVWDYLTFRYVPGNRCIWEDIWKLPPGHCLSVPAGEPPPPSRPYWTLPRPARPDELSGARQDAELDAQFTALLDDAVRLRLIADVPVGIMLSGGLDSSVVAALAARQGHRPLLTFSVAFEGAPEIDELPFARMVADHVGAEHHELRLTAAGFLEQLPAFVRTTDEPLADLASIPLGAISALAADRVKVVLSGEGADEILAGYTFDRVARDWAAAPTPVDLRRWPVPPHMTNYMTSAEKRNLLARPGDWPDSMDRVRGHIDRAGDTSALDQILYAYGHDWLVEDLLMKADKMSMARSLELRTPFLDYRLVAWAAAAPAAAKTGPDSDGVFTTKRSLRRLAAKLLPPAIVQRPKMGFPVPVYGWLAGPYRDFAHDRLADPAAPLRNWCRPEALDNALSAGTAAETDPMDRHRLWHLLVLNEWMREWL